MKIGNVKIEFMCGNIHSVEADRKLTECRAFDQEAMRAAVAEILVVAQSKGDKTLAVSDFGCKDEVFPIAGMARIMAQECMRYARMYSDPTLGKITFCLAEENSFSVFENTFQGYVKHMLEDLGSGPYVTVDVIIELEKGIILIERSNPPYGWALPGGFLDYGESLEEAAIREAKEETDMDLLNLRQFHTFSNPGRDPRFHTISTVFIAKGKGNPQFGDDAKGLKIVGYEELLELEYAFDHKGIIREYLSSKNLY